MPGLILLILLVLICFGSVPTWPYSRRWGYGPSGVLGLLVLVLLVLMLVNIVPAPWTHVVVVQ